mmetsp:Transcript_51936/g.145043  ORF Transcript_51936/g.145043 Transcript_51936/m.145043 type:complete len:261 (+) Transcript_51936:67-849(+)
MAWKPAWTNVKGGQQAKWTKGGAQGKGFGRFGGKGQQIWMQFAQKIAKATGKGGSKGSDKFKLKLGKMDASLKVWVGSLPTSTTWKDLEKHFTEAAGKPKLTEIMGRGTACVAYATEGEAASAIAAVSGTELGGKTIEADVWTQKEKGMKAVKSVVNTKFAKKPAVTVDTKTLEKLSKIDHSLKVYIGGLAETVTWKQLEKHAAELAKKPAVTFVRPHKGTACLAFKEEEDVGNAIAALNGSELQGRVLEADVWTKPEKK